MSQGLPRQEAIHGDRATVAETSAPGRPWWLLLLPFCFLLHILEEWFGGPGFPAWTTKLGMSGGVSPSRLVAINTIAWPGSMILTTLGIVLPQFGWFPAAFATMLVLNAVLHAVGTLLTSCYSPGLVTGLLAFLPVGLTALAYCRRVLPPHRFALSIVAGVFIHACVVAVTFS
jgi:hypothetical protein